MIPLSFAQRRLWFLAQLEGRAPPTTSYGVAAAGRPGCRALRAALRDVTAGTRACAPCSVGPRRRAVPADARRRGTPLSGWHARDGTRAVSEALRRRPRGTASTSHRDPGPGRLFRLDRTSRVLVLVVHHIAGDGWSMAPARPGPVGGVRRPAGRAGAGVGPLPVQYADYTLWQRELLGDEDDPDSVLARQLALLARRAGGRAGGAGAAADRPRPAVASHRGARSPFGSAPSCTSRLLELARAQRRDACSWCCRPPWRCC